jgi:hypothetical protein
VDYIAASLKTAYSLDGAASPGNDNGSNWLDISEIGRAARKMSEVCFVIAIALGFVGKVVVFSFGPCAGG